MFEQALFIGMTPEEYWEKDPSLFWTYRKVHKMKLRAKTEELNYLAWFIGLYNTHSINACFSKRGKYPSEPLDLGVSNNDDEVVKKRYQEKQVMRARNSLNNWAMSFKGKFSKDTKK